MARLLYHNIRPVFVFDGAAPALKLQTIQARQQRRWEADLNVERSARRILAAQMHRLLSSNTTTTADVQENRDEGTWEEKGGENETTEYKASYQKRRNENNSSPQVHVQGVVVLGDHLEEDDGSLNTSILPDVTMTGNTSTRQHDGDRKVNDEEIQWQPGDADEREGGEESMDDEDDIVLPEEDGIDINVIAALPIHMRKKVIEKAQRNERMRSRRMYMPLAGDAQRFCNAQIQNLIRGSELNRKIKNLQEQKHEKVVSSKGEGAERSIASDETRKFIVTTESSNVEGDSTQATVEGRLGTYEGFEEWDYKSSDDDEREDDIKYGGGGFIDAKVGHMERNESSSTMKIMHEEKSATRGGKRNKGKSHKSVDNMKTEYDDGTRGFLSNMGDAAVSDSSSTIKRAGAVLEGKNSNDCDNFVVNKNIQASSSTIHKMDGNSGRGGNESGVVQRSNNYSLNVMIPTNMDEVQSQERQQDTQQQQYHPSQWNDAVEDGFEFELDNNSHLSHATTAGDRNTTIGFRILQQEEEKDHGTAAAAATAALQQQQGLTRSDNETNEAAAVADSSQEVFIRDVDLEFNPEDLSYADAHPPPPPPLHPPPSFNPVSDRNDGSRADKAIEQSSGILGNMPDYVKRQFQRHIKEYYRKEMLPPSSMDEHDDNSEEKIHGSSSGGIILEEDDEWEDGMMNNQKGGSIDDDDPSIVKEAAENHVGSLPQNEISCGAEYDEPITSLTVVSSQCKSEECDGSFKRGNNTSLPLTPTRTSSNSINIRSLDDKPEVSSSFGGMESTMTQALNVEESSANNLVVDTCKVMTVLPCAGICVRISFFHPHITLPFPVPRCCWSVPRLSLSIAMWQQ